MIFFRPVTRRAILTAFSFASAPDRQKNVFSSPGGVTSVSSSAARSLEGKAAPGRLGERLAHAGVPVSEAGVPDHAAEVPPARAVCGDEADAGAVDDLERHRARLRAPCVKDAR